MNNLIEALNDPIWKSHFIGKEYSMDGQPGWKIAYYPIFEDGKTGERYDAPKALVERPSKWSMKRDGGKSELIDGIDFREVPLHYLTYK